MIGVQHHDDFFVLAACHTGVQSHLIDFTIEHHLYTPNKETSKKKENKKQKQLKIQMKCLYVKFHGFSKSSISESQVPKC